MAHQTIRILVPDDDRVRLTAIISDKSRPFKHVQRAQITVLSIDETSQIQVPGRSQPGVPIKPGKAATLTRDDKRHGTTTLFTALEIATGTTISQDMQRHRHQDFIRFLNTVNRSI